jgi:hypothetical protein
MPAGGVGLTGWQSATFNALGSPFQAGGSIGNTSFGVSSLPGSPMQATGGTVGLVAGSASIGSIGNTSFASGQPMHRVSTTLTTPTGITYTGATTANPLAICAAASVTICVPLTVTLSATQANAGYLTHVVLQKSTTGATAASFRVLAFQTAPTLTATYDATAYTVAAADVLSGARLGIWECTVADANLMTFECSPTSSSGYNVFNTANATLYFVLEATGAYVRATGETFTVIADVSAQVP